MILDQIDRDQLFSQVLNVIAGSTMIGSGLWLIYEILPDGGLDCVKTNVLIDYETIPLIIVHFWL